MIKAPACSDGDRIGLILKYIVICRELEPCSSFRPLLVSSGPRSAGDMSVCVCVCGLVDTSLLGQLVLCGAECHLKRGARGVYRTLYTSQVIPISKLRAPPHFFSWTFEKFNLFDFY